MKSTASKLAVALAAAVCLLHGEVHAAPPATCAAIEEDTDYSGNDIAQTIQDAAEKCCADCAKTPGCTAFNWSPNDQGSFTCWLKSVPANKVVFPGAGRAAKLIVPSGSCAPIQENTDLPGNDLGDPLQLDSATLCCDACSNRKDCKAYVWIQRDVGTCILKSTVGAPSPYPGARASTPTSTKPLIVPTPSPTPSPAQATCGTVESGYDYPGNDLIATSRANYQDCCIDCQTTPGCSLYVWGAGTCNLKSKKGARVAAKGAKAAVLPVTVLTSKLNKVQSAIYGTFPLPQTAYSFVPGAQWIDQGTLAVVKAQVEAFVINNLATNLSHGQEPLPMFTQEASLGISAYINVTSAGECAALTTAWQFNFFTYDTTSQYCLVNVNDADTTLAMLSAAGTTMIYPQSLDDAYKAKTTANVASNSACVAACQASNGCAGVVYSTSAKSCALFQPKPSNFANLVAGWVFNPVTNVDTGSVQYSRMAMSTLPNAYIKQSVPGVASSDACALAATKAGYTLFGYNSATKVCSYFAPTASTTKA
ncbi:hypothetical protein As57867_016900, partial [Aphanomyces stellatus]